MPTFRKKKAMSEHDKMERRRLKIECAKLKAMLDSNRTLAMEECAKLRGRIGETQTQMDGIALERDRLRIELDLSEQARGKIWTEYEHVCKAQYIEIGKLERRAETAEAEQRPAPPVPQELLDEIDGLLAAPENRSGLYSEQRIAFEWVRDRWPTWFPGAPAEDRPKGLAHSLGSLCPMCGKGVWDGECKVCAPLVPAPDQEFLTKLRDKRLEREDGAG